MSGIFQSGIPIAPPADNAKGLGSNVAFIPAGAGVAQTITPAVPQNAVSIVNMTANVLRVTVTFSAGIVSGGTPAQRCLLVPPLFTIAEDLSSNTDGGGAGEITPIASLSVVPLVNPTASAEGSTIAVATAATAGLVYFNFLTS
jgi:hypothetical protein